MVRGNICWRSHSAAPFQHQEVAKRSPATITQPEQSTRTQVPR
ncbi:hypothetical protein [Leptolyngbya sp. FACHB-541]|nr:hypothetical protein [Leptolyngbya sp. FACHB-541]